MTTNEIIEFHKNGSKKSVTYPNSENGLYYQLWYPCGRLRYEEYRKNGNLHREDGPAVTNWYNTGDKEFEAYYLNGVRVTKNELGFRTMMGRL